MLTGPKFARVSYVLFSIAIMAALLKLGGLTGVKPFILRTAPATPAVAKAAEPARENQVGASLDLPERKYTLGGRLLPGTDGRPDGEDGDAPVFYRPSPAREADGDSGEPVCGNLGDFPKSSRVVFPLPEAYFGSYEDTWGAARPQGGHEGADLMSQAETPEFAITDGAIVPVSGANEDGWNRLGGYTLMLKAAYDAGPIKKGDLFYYAHLDEESALPIGTKVRAGQRIGYAGDTGEGREGTRGKFPSHLHLGWYDTGSASDRTDLESGAMNPYPLLLWLEDNGGAVAGGTDATYCEAPQGPEPESNSPAQTNPGTRPDLDTGDADDARPSPIVEESRQDRSPKRQSKPDEKKEPGKSDQRTDAQSKDKVPADEPEKRNEAESSETPAPDEDQASLPSVEDSSLGAKGREKARYLSDPRLNPDQASLPSNAEDRAEKDGDRQSTDPPDEKEEPKPSDLPKDKEPEDRTQPAPCGPSGKAGEGRVVRVTRHQADGQQTPIGREEWLALIKADPDMRACKTVGSDQTLSHKVLAVWTGHPDHDEVRFYLRGGKVVVENPDDPTIKKMRKIAYALGARVEDR